MSFYYIFDDKFNFYFKMSLIKLIRLSYIKYVIIYLYL